MSELRPADLAADGLEEAGHELHLPRVLVRRRGGLHVLLGRSGQHATDLFNII